MPAQRYTIVTGMHHLSDPLPTIESQWWVFETRIILGGIGTRHICTRSVLYDMEPPNFDVKTCFARNLKCDVGKCYTDNTSNRSWGADFQVVPFDVD